MKRRPPAYARALRDLLDRREYPERVLVYYGADWKRRPAVEPCLCVGDDYAPWNYDWSVLAGLAVEIMPDLSRYEIELVAEIAAVAAPVMVRRLGKHFVPESSATMDRICAERRGHELYKPWFETADAYLYPVRTDPRLAVLWSEAAEADYLAREAEYWRAVAADRGVQVSA